MKTPIITIYQENLTNIVRNIENFDFHNGDDCEIIMQQRLHGKKIDLIIGFDYFTENEDGTICNSEKDTKHYYLEIWEDFNEGDADAPIEVYWLSDNEAEREDQFFEAFAYMTTLLQEYSIKQEVK